jgi:FlaA1/EpsC-like NDP-sugar epimerase
VVDIEQLLRDEGNGRDPEPVGQSLEGRSVLVTGAGGSIGSGLCRQICQCRPTRLILVGNGEYSIYQIQTELAFRYPEVPVRSVIADVGNRARMDLVFRTLRPEIVFHAAARKFLSLVEANPEEGVMTNVFGTRTLASLAREHGAAEFVYISTDKAVRPISVLGATKRLAELLIQDLAREGGTRFVTVRFGNVLRSRGSVVGLFEQQIARGGPVTVTHPQARRFFMSLGEAVHLVLRSSEIGRNGDLCVLDMGEQVGIADLAAALIRLHGQPLQPEIRIVFTDLAPGEKLSEELLSPGEAAVARQVGKVLVCPPPESDGRVGEAGLDELRQAAAG